MGLFIKKYIGVKNPEPLKEPIVLQFFILGIFHLKVGFYDSFRYPAGNKQQKIGKKYCFKS